MQVAGERLLRSKDSPQVKAAMFVPLGAVLAASPKLDDVWHGLQAVRGQHVHFFDGSAFFNRPGPRLIDTLEKVAELVAAWDESQA